MKLVYTALMALALTACGAAPGTTSEMEGKGSNASNLSATDANGMGTISGTTTSLSTKKISGATPAPTPAADDPAARSNDTGNAAEKKAGDPKASMKDKLDASRPGTADDTKKNTVR